MATPAIATYVKDAGVKMELLALRTAFEEFSATSAHAQKQLYDVTVLIKDHLSSMPTGTLLDPIKVIAENVP